MKKIIISGIAFSGLLVLSGCSLSNTVGKSIDITEKNESGSMVKEEPSMIQKEVMEKNDAMMKKGDTMVKNDDSAMMKKDAMKTGSYTNYSTSAVESALASGKKVVLFFHAPWCPSCKSADTKLSQETIPENTIVFKTDYDSSGELKKKYGVTSQHTFVSLKSDGTMIKKAS
jgi:thiol-disulfide isomerase/thioredoxin